MNSEITMRLSHNTLYRGIVKVLLILLLAVAAGYFYEQGVKADNARADELTVEEYTANFEAYKESLREDDWGLPGTIALWLVIVVLFFGIYEGVPWALAIAMGHLIGPQRQASYGPPDDAAT